MSSPVVLITGASNGIGLATAEHLAKAKYKVYATCRDPSAAVDLQKIARIYINISILPLDVKSDDSVTKAVTAIYNKEGAVDVVINNAGFGIYGPAEIHTIEEIRDIFETNLLGVVRVNNAVLPIMRKQLRGRIINISSISGAIPSKNMPIYSASKAALESLSASDAYALERWNIKVIVIQPGPVVTGFEPRTPYGSRFKTEDHPYTNLSMDRERWKMMMDNGQSTYEVAKVIKKAIEAPKPRFWYQTSQSVREQIDRQFKDIKGENRVPKPYIPALPLPAKL